MLQGQMVELLNFFEFVVVGDECDGAKPFPDPFAFEDSVSGVKAGVAAGMPVVAFVIEETLRRQNCGKHWKRLRGRQSNNSCNLKWQSHISFSISVPVLLSHSDTPGGIYLFVVNFEIIRIISEIEGHNEKILQM